MSDYTPKTEEILNCYIDSVERHVEPTNREELVAEFNRWLTSEIEKAEYRGAVKAGRAIVGANLAKSDHEFGEFM